MNLEDDAPSAWRLLWSPRAMAWWARYRTELTLRWGTAVAGIWIGMMLGWFWIAANEPFAEPAGHTMMGSLVVCVVTVVFIHGMTWLKRIRPHEKTDHYFFACIAIATLPGCVIDVPDSFLSIYRDAAHFATFDPANPVWPPLPASIESMTQTCVFSVGSIFLWLVYLNLALLHLRRLPSPEVTDTCLSCGYDLRGTRAAGIGRCPECGAEVRPIEEMALGGGNEPPGLDESRGRG